MSLREASTGTASTGTEIRIESEVESSPTPANGYDSTGSFALKGDPPMDTFDQEKHAGYTSSSTSQPGSRGSFEEDDEFDYENNLSNEERDVVADNMKTRKRAPSIQSTVSSIPGSVVVYPHAKGQGLPYQLDNYSLNKMGKTRAKMNDSGVKGGERRYKLAPQLREYDSPFRHPSSVCAMQMDDEDDDDDDTDYFPSPASRKGRRSQYGTRSPRMSDVSLRSAATPPSVKRSSYDYQSPHAKSPLQTEDVKKEYPLVLLHCTLLPPSLPLSASSRAKMPSPELLKEMLPELYWNRLKLLEDKIGASSILRERGVLISHPQDAYDLLEERLLESLDLVRPRLAYGHFVGASEEDADGLGKIPDSDRAHTNCSSDDELEGAAGNCLDCGQKVLGNPESDEKRWEVRVYAANGLMKGGAWGAAWRDMEKVDIEVGVWLPSDVRRDLDRRIAYEETRKAEAELRAAEDEKRRMEVYGDSPGLTQDQIDGLDDYDMSSPAEERLPSPPPLHKQPPFRPEHRYSEGQVNAVDLQAALINYIRLLGRDRLFTLATIALVLLALLTPSPFNYGSQSQDLTASYTTSSAPVADTTPPVASVEVAAPIIAPSLVSNSVQRVSAMSALSTSTMSTESAASATSAVPESSMPVNSELHEESALSESSTPACIIPPAASESAPYQPAPIIDPPASEEVQTAEQEITTSAAPTSAAVKGHLPVDLEDTHEQKNMIKHDNTASRKPKGISSKAHE